MRIIFFGATELGYRCCEQLLQMGQNVVGIFTIPQEFQISYSKTPVRNVTFCSFDTLAQQNNIPATLVTTKMSDTYYVDAVSALKPDLAIVIGWYYMIPRTLRELFPKGVVGIHASLLPKYRGGAPLVWAIINGENKTGVTLFYFDAGVDTGNIIGQKEFGIEKDATIKTVYGKTTEASLELLRTYVPMLAAGTAPNLGQDHSAATQFPQRGPGDGLINWGSKSAEQAYDWIRAQTRPYPGAFTYFDDEKVTIWRARVSPAYDQCHEPGSVVRNVSDSTTSLGIVCADKRILLVDELSVSDGTVMSGSRFIATRPAGLICGGEERELKLTGDQRSP